MAYSTRDLTDLHRVFESASAGLLVIGADGRCTLCNRAAAAILRKPQSAVVGTDVHALLHPGHDQQPEECPIDAARRGEQRTAVNDELEAEWSAVAAGGADLVITLHDIRGWRALEARVEQVARLHSLGRLAASMAHEFNNVLMGIAPFAEVIRRGKNVESAASHIQNAVQRGKRITHDILRFTNPPAPVRVPIDVESWLQSVAAEARALLPASCALRVEVEPGGLQVDGDPGQLQQLLVNLILNARDAIGRDGVITIGVWRERAGVHFIVRDTGAGIRPEHLEHVFEPLFTTKKAGTGLGLAVAWQIVERHGGRISVESEPGTGTTFHIVLPPGTARKEAAAAEESGQAGAWRVLLVEDDEAVASGMIALMEMEGMAVELARTGEEALAAVRRRPPQVVILDLALPDMPGREVFAAIERLAPRLPIVFATGHMERDPLEAMTTRPDVTYLLKPFEFDALTAAMRRVLTAATGGP